MSKPPYPSYEKLVAMKTCTSCKHYHWDIEYSPRYSTCPCAKCHNKDEHVPSTLAYEVYKRDYERAW